MGDDPTWTLLFFLPNLKLPAPSPLRTEWVYICDGGDPQVATLKNSPSNVTARTMLGQYHSSFGKPYVPAVLLARDDAPPEIRRADTMRAYRNICAVSTIGHAIARTIVDGGSLWLPRHTDHFLFDSHVPAKNGWITTLEAMVEGMTDEVSKFHGHCSAQISIPWEFSFSLDKLLFKRLAEQWKSHYVAKLDERPLRQLFRALEVAFQAGRYPSDGLTSVNDVGTRIGLWVSAFEVLFHPGEKGEVNKRVVLDSIGRYPWREESLQQLRFSASYGGKTVPICFGQEIYNQLYSARNAFMHGNPVSDADQHLSGGKKNLPLAMMAPVLFDFAIRAFLEDEFPRDTSQEEEDEDYFFGVGDLEDALVIVLDGDEAGRSVSNGT